MRNLFDQYRHPENRLTHALLTALHEDHLLLGNFIAWATNKQTPTSPSQFHILEQSLPGEEEPQDEDEAERRGLPDGCIYDDNGWGLLIESKIAAPLELDQLQRHRRTAEKRGLINPLLLALIARIAVHPLPDDVVIRQWTELYKWLEYQNRSSDWPRCLRGYMEVLESKLPKEEYLTGGTLTVFTGIPFEKKNPYSYLEGKRVLRLAMDELRVRNDLKQQLGIDQKTPGRSAITGKDSTGVWDFLRLEEAGDAVNFTEFPHLTLSIHREYLHAIVIVPHGIRNDFRHNLLDGGIEKFRSLFESILMEFSKLLGKVEGAFPCVEVVQRRYPTQRAVPFMDAKLEFDLRTGFENSFGLAKSAKTQPEWLEAAYNALLRKNSNLQLAVGTKFIYERCPEVRKEEILNHISNAWISCKPLINTMIH